MSDQSSSIIQSVNHVNDIASKNPRHASYECHRLSFVLLQGFLTLFSVHPIHVLTFKSATASFVNRKLPRSDTAIIWITTTVFINLI